MKSRIDNARTFDAERLKTLLRIESDGDLAARLGLHRSWVGRRRRAGLTFFEADTWAVRCGFLPFEVWPEWADETIEEITNV